MRCENLYQQAPPRHTGGMTIAADEAPRFFAALKDARSLPVEDALGDPRTRPLAPYLTESGTGALLAAPIRFGDRLAGVVIHEHVGSRRAWSTEAQSFAASIADFAARALAAADRNARQQDLRLAYERLGRLHDRLEGTKEEERRFLARELHDELGQMLTVLKLRLQIGASALGPVMEAGEGFTDLLTVVDDLIARVRSISVDLRPPLLDEVGLISAVRFYLESQAAVSGVTIELETRFAVHVPERSSRSSSSIRTPSQRAPRRGPDSPSTIAQGRGARAESAAGAMSSTRSDATLKRSTRSSRGGHSLTASPISTERRQPSLPVLAW